MQGRHLNFEHFSKRLHLTVATESQLMWSPCDPYHVIRMDVGGRTHPTWGPIPNFDGC
ncbi:unnamed protein product [Musa acuminata subsp. burmannicoides]